MRTTVLVGIVLAISASLAGCDCGGVAPTGNDDGGGVGYDPDGGTSQTDGGGSTLPDGGTSPGLDAGTDAGTGDVDAGWGPTDGGFVTVACQGHIYACGDGIDNDGDGLTDWQDPDCLGPCDANESGFATEIPGGDSTNGSRDCYFDQDSGGGNDTCAWATYCDPLSPGEPDGYVYDADKVGTKSCPTDTNGDSYQSDTCLDVCMPLTPNGCDCFGCCELPAGSGQYVFIGTGVAAKDPTCTLETIDDPDLCRPCTPVPDCAQGCGRCQLCIGKTEVPPDCYVDPGDPGGGLDGGYTVGDGGVILGPDGGPITTPDGGVVTVPDGGYDGGVINPDQCPGGEQACGLPGQPTCPGGYYCITGCCRFVG